MKIPLLALKDQHTTLADGLRDAFERVLASDHFILGDEVAEFEKEIAALLGVRHAIGMSSGSDALLAALMELGLAPGDEVITTPYSFFATAGCIARLGGRPVFVDVQPDTLNLDPSQVAERVTSRTKAIMPVHLFGLPADMTELSAIANRHGLTVVEDACQAIGASYRGQPAGALGDVAAFSFFPSKNLGALGDGGMLTVNDDDRAARLRMLRAHGSRKKYHHELLGGNFRLDALQAAFLRAKLPYLTIWNSARRANANQYRELFANAKIETVLQLPPEPMDRTHVYHQFVIRVPKRDHLRAALTAAGIGTEVYYTLPLHLQPCFADLGYQRGSCPNAEAAAATSLALPIFPELTRNQQEYVVDQVTKALRT